MFIKVVFYVIYYNHKSTILALVYNYSLGKKFPWNSNIVPNGAFIVASICIVKALNIMREVSPVFPFFETTKIDPSSSD